MNWKPCEKTWIEHNVEKTQLKTMWRKINLAKMWMWSWKQMVKHTYEVVILLSVSARTTLQIRNSKLRSALQKPFWSQRRHLQCPNQTKTSLKPECFTQDSSLGSSPASWYGTSPASSNTNCSAHGMCFTIDSNDRWSRCPASNAERNSSVQGSRTQGNSTLPNTSSCIIYADSEEQRLSNTWALQSTIRDKKVRDWRSAISTVETRKLLFENSAIAIVFSN